MWCLWFKTEQRVFTNFYRQMFCWMDHWYRLSMEDIRALEDRTKQELDEVPLIIHLFFFVAKVLSSLRVKYWTTAILA